MDNNMAVYVAGLKKQGITVSEIINKSGIGSTSFYDIMNNKQIPKLNTAYKIVNALGTTIYEVFPDSEVIGVDKNE